MYGPPNSETPQGYNKTRTNLFRSFLQLPQTLMVENTFDPPKMISYKTHIIRWRSRISSVELSQWGLYKASKSQVTPGPSMLGPTQELLD